MHSHGIANLDTDRNPLALVSVSEVDDSYKDSMFNKRLDQFLLYKVHDVTGLNWQEFINQPRDVVTGIIDRLAKSIETESKAIAKAQAAQKAEERKARNEHQRSSGNAHVPISFNPADYQM